MADMSDVFISYSRTDRAFVVRLYATLEAAHRKPWIDWSDIPPTADWQQEIYDAIEAADTFVFVLSPDALLSRPCLDELAHAVAYKKRIVPLLWRDVVVREVPPSIAAPQWILFREQDDFTAAFKQLEFALDTDIAFWHLSTQLLIRARQWESQGKDSSVTLRGKELAEAERWLADSTGKTPPPTELHRAFISASRKASAQRQRTVISVLSGVSIALLILSILSFSLYQNAQQQRQLATTQRDAAIARQLALQANTFMNNQQPDLALLLSIEASKLNENQYTRETLLNTLVDSPHLQTMYYTQNPLALKSVAVAPDGQTLYAASGGIYTWNLDHFPHMATLLPGTANLGINTIVMSPDGRFLGATSKYGLLLLDPKTGNVFRHLGSPSATNSKLAFSADGQRVWSIEGTQPGSSTGTSDLIRQWDIQSGAQIGNPIHIPFAEDFHSLFSPDGQWFATAACAGPNCEQTQVRIWDLRQAKVALTISITGLEVTALAFSHHSGEIAIGVCPLQGDNTSGCNNGSIQIRSTTAGALRFSAPVRNALGQVTGLAFSPDDTALVSALGLGNCSGNNCNQGQMQLWAVHNLHMVNEPFAGHIRGFSQFVFLPDGYHVASIAGDNRLYLWQISGYDALSHMSIVPNIDGVVNPHQLVYDPSGATIWEVNGSQVNHWDPLHGTLKSSINLRQLVSSQTGIYGAALSADGKLLAYCDGDIVLMNTADQTILRHLHSEQPAHGCEAQVFSPDGRYLAALSLAQTTQVAVYNVATGAIVSQMEAPGALLDDEFSNIRFTADSSMIACSTPQGLMLWHVTTGQLVGPPFGGNMPMPYVFSPDNQTMAFMNSSQELSLWNYHTGKQIGTLGPLQPSRGYQVQAFSKDGRYLLTSGYYDVTIWDTTSHTPYVVFPHVGPRSSAAIFSADGKYVAFGDGDGLVLTRPVTTAAWRQSACTMAGRNLTAAEWQQYIPGLPYTQICQAPASASDTTSS